MSVTGNFVGPLVFRKQDAPEYAFGFIVVVITSLAAGILCLVYRFHCVWQNKRRDRGGTMEGFDHAYDDDLTDIKVSKTPLCGCVVYSPESRIHSSGIFSEISQKD